jgi:hypothetical protein
MGLFGARAKAAPLQIMGVAESLAPDEQAAVASLWRALL